MAFLSPLFLAGAAAAVVPIVLHLIKREPEPRVKFSAVKLLRTAPVELAKTRRLRELLLLALRVAALVLLAVAFARPFFGSGGGMSSAGATIVAIDTSYSMSAPGRIDRARQLAKAAVDRASSRELVGVVTFSDVADAPIRPSPDRALAISVIDRVAWGFGSTRYRVGLDAAARALDGRKGTIVVVTDLQECGWDAGDRASIPESVRIEIADVGPLPPNFAVTSIGAAGGHVSASVRNADARARDARVWLTLDGRQAGETMVAIGPDAAAEVTFSLPPSRGSAPVVAQVAVDDRDGLQADNARYAVLDQASRPSILVVTAAGELEREAFYVQSALAAAGVASAGYQVVGSSAAQLSTSDAARLSPHTAILLLSTRGLERKGREALAGYVRAGGGLLVAAGPEIDAEVIAGVLGEGTPLRIVPPAAAEAEPRRAVAAGRQNATTLAPTDVRHPLFQPFGENAAMLGLVKFRTVARIGGPDCQTLARFTSGEAALIDCPAGDGRALIIASDLDNRWNDFPVRASFVPFIHEAVAYLGSARPHASEYLVADAPPGIPRRPGVVTVSDAIGGSGGTDEATGRSRRIAINVDPREGDPARLSADEFQSAVTRLRDAGTAQAHLEAKQQEDRQHLWRYVLAIMIAALAVEGVVASRTT
jgi:hypothetical protein